MKTVFLTIVRGHSVQIKNRQSGAALIVGMFMLLLLTIIGLSAMQGVTMQERMSGNMRDATMALESAEVGLRYIEDGFLNNIEELDVGLAYADCNATCQIIDARNNSTPQHDLLAGSSAWSAEAINYGAYKNTAGNLISPPTGTDMGTTASIPKLMVEYVAYKGDSLGTGTGVVDDTGLDLYRTSVKANGGTSNSEAMLQVIYARRFR
jgi:type IV pilus assembly protein PilX